MLALAMNCAELRYLGLEGCLKITDEAFIKLAASCHSIVSATTWGVPGITLGLQEARCLAFSV